MLATRVEFDVRPDYHQFYLLRGDTNSDASSVSTDGYQCHLECTGGFGYVGTWRSAGTGPVVVEVHDRRPPWPPDDAQHVVEDSMEGEGPLAVESWGGTPGGGVLDTPEGPLRLRVRWTGLFPEDYDVVPEVVREHIVIQLWPAPVVPRSVLVWSDRWRPLLVRDQSSEGRPQVQGRDAVRERLRTLTILPVWYPRDARPALPGGDRGEVLTLAHHANDGFQAYAIIDRVETIRPITHDEAANLAAQAGRWTVYRHSDGALLSLDPAIYAGYAAYGADATSEDQAAQIADPGRYGALIGLLSPVRPDALALLEQLGAAVSISDADP